MADPAAPPAVRRGSGLRLPYWASSVFVVTVLLLVTWNFVTQNLAMSYGNAQREARADVTLLSGVTQESLRRTVEAIDHQLRMLRDMYAGDPHHFAATVTSHDFMLRDFTTQLAVVGPDGIVLYSSLGTPSTIIDVSDREHIRVQLDSAEDDLFIGKPVIGRISGQPTVQFTRKIMDARGGLLGVIVISLDAHHLARSQNAAILGNNRLMIVGLDGVVRFSSPSAEMTGKDITLSGLLREAKLAQHGSYRGELEPGTESAFVSFHRMDDFGLIVAAAVPETAAFRSYRTRVTNEVGAGLFTSLLFIAFGIGQARYRYHRQRSDLALEASEARLRGLLGASPDALIVVDQAGHIILASDHVATVFGYDPAELVGQPIATLVPDRCRGAHDAHVHGYFANPAVRSMGTGLEIAGRRKDGNTFPAEISLSTYACEQGTFVIAAVRDVTTQQQTQQELRRWTAAFEKAAFGLSITDAKTLNLIAVNPAYAAMHGMSVEELRQYPVMDLVVPEDHETVQNALAVADRTGQVTYELTRRRKDGSLFDGQLAITTVHDEHGEPLYRVATLLDISERKRVQAAAERWAEAFDKAAFGISITDGGSRNLMVVNQAYAAMHGMTVEELRGYPVDQLYAPDEIEHVERERALAAKAGYINFEATRRRKDGTLFPSQTTLTDVRNADGQLIYRIGSVLDISETRQIRNRLQQAQKMEAIGNLAAGIAHDFNNLLGTIINNQDLIIDDAARDPAAVQRYAEDTLSAAFSGAALVKHLLGFARQQAMHLRPFGFDELMEHMLPILHRTIGENIEVGLSSEPDLWPMMGDLNHLENALLNLALNARDAMPEGGTLSINAQNATVDIELFSELLSPQPGDYVRISVTDSGIGMSAEALARAFEPFFTTKGVGEGSGLGLSMVLGSLEQMGGTAKIYSEPGEGTTVELYIPRAMPAIPAEPASSVAKIEPRGMERILVVEDNEMIRSSVTTMLKGLGYRVEEAQDAPSALSLLEAGERFDLLFTDIVLPKRVSGVELAGIVRARWPEMRILLTSGFANPTHYQEQINALGLTVLMKPYRKSVLAEQIRAALS